MATLPQETTSPVMTRHNRRSSMATWLPTAVLTVLAIIFLIPLAWMLDTSVRPENAITEGIISWIPRPLTFENYSTILSDSQNPIGRWFINSALVAVAATVLTLLIASSAAYALARLSFPGKNAIFIIFL